ncbi:MAG TPA: peptidylprolyl isomerase, partial [Frankiaceae bacterium]|nr:peptidylprolyl isomerase [Frankiaceae bacterium]
PVACGATRPPAPVTQRYPREPPLSIDRAARYVMSMKTSCGTIEVELFADKAPRTVNSFAFLASKRFFGGVEFSRSTDPKAGFAVLQGGDQEGTGAGGPGYTLPDENLKGARYVRGTVAMANTGRPNTGGSQFFLVADTLQLPLSYTPFGRVTEGLDVLDRILALGNDGSNPAGGGRPSQRVYIERLTVTKAR